MQNNCENNISLLLLLSKAKLEETFILYYKGINHNAMSQLSLKSS